MQTNSSDLQRNTSTTAVLLTWEKQWPRSLVGPIRLEIWFQQRVPGRFCPGSFHRTQKKRCWIWLSILIEEFHIHHAEEPEELSFELQGQWLDLQRPDFCMRTKGAEVKQDSFERVQKCAENSYFFKAFFEKTHPTWPGRCWSSRVLVEAHESIINAGGDRNCTEELPCRNRNDIHVKLMSHRQMLQATPLWSTSWAHNLTLRFSAHSHHSLCNRHLPIFPALRPVQKPMICLEQRPGWGMRCWRFLQQVKHVIVEICGSLYDLANFRSSELNLSSTVLSMLKSF